MTSFSVGLLGHGTVGGAFHELLDSRADAIEATTGQRPEISGVLTRSRGDFSDILERSDLVVEAIVEKLPVKRDLFARLGDLCPDRTLLSSNSSSFVPSAMADASGRADRFLNLHFFNPALVMRCVEVVRGPHTSDAAITAALSFVERIGYAPERQVWVTFRNGLSESLLAGREVIYAPFTGPRDWKNFAKLVKLARVGKVVLLPHMGSATLEGRIDMGEKVIVNIKTFLDGHRPPDRVLPSML